MSRWRSRCLDRTSAIALVLLALPVMSNAEDTFVTIHKVNGNRMLVVKDDAGIGGGRGRGMRRGNALPNGPARGRGRRVGASALNSITVAVPASAKITSAMRERRTFEFRVLAELPGGLRHRAFQKMEKPLQARIVTKNNAIIEVNVITGETDINQSGSASDGQIVLAVRPKRPPTKRKP